MNARAGQLGVQPANLFSVLARQWRLVDVPLRPSAQDVAAYEGIVHAWQDAHPERAARALLLGVTAEIATMKWPLGAALLAMDHSLPMVTNVWPRPAHGSAVCADWRAMPLPPRSRDIALGDGCMTLLSRPVGQAIFADNLRRVLTDEGLLALRCFCRPEELETPADVFADLRARRVQGFHAFKWRLAMAVHGRAGDGVRLGDVWDCWAAEIDDADALAEHCGWPVELVRSMEMYRDAETRYRFATVEEVRQALAPRFSLESQQVGGYELAERCPILVFRPA